MSEMIIEVPDLGDVGDVEVIEIPLEAGQRIEKDATMLVLESEKASMEVPVPRSGLVKDIKVAVGDKVSSGTPVLVLDVSDSEDQAPAPTTAGDETDSKSVPTSPVSPETGQNQERAAAPEALRTVPLKVPDLGDMNEVEVIEIAVKPGDEIVGEQSLLTLESEKASMEMPSPVSGQLLDLTVTVGDKVKSGDVIGHVRLADDAASVAPESTGGSGDVVVSQPAPQTTPATSPRPPVPDRPALHQPPRKDVVHASPAVRRFARELGVDLTRVRGSGPKGRILKDDVQAYVKDELARPKATAATGAFAMPELPQIDHSKFGTVEQVPLTRIQKVSSVNLHRNWITIPHVTQHDEADITELEAFRKSMKDEAAREGVRLTPLAFMMKAVVCSLKAFPTFNASLAADGEQLILKKYYHIGVAVDTPNGLVVPVIRDVDQKGVLELARELGEVSAKARDGKLAPGAMQGSSFSISSLGGIGGTAFTPIVNWPDVAILGVSKSRMQPVWNGKEFVPRLMLPLSLSYDHRVIDGAVAARFITHLSGVLADIRKILL